MNRFFKKLTCLICIFVIIVSRISPCFADSEDWSKYPENLDGTHLLIKNILDSSEDREGVYTPSTRRLLLETLQVNNIVTRQLKSRSTQLYLFRYAKYDENSSYLDGVMNPRKYDRKENKYKKSDLNKVIEDSIEISYYLTNSIFEHDDNENSDNTANNKNSILQIHLEEHDNCIFKSTVEINDESYYEKWTSTIPNVPDSALRFSISAGLTNRKLNVFKTEKKQLEKLATNLETNEKIISYNDYYDSMMEKIDEFKNDETYYNRCYELFDSEMKGENVSIDSAIRDKKALFISYDQFEMGQNMYEAKRRDGNRGWLIVHLIQFFISVFDDIVNIVQNQIFPYSPTAVAVRNIKDNKSLKKYIEDTYGKLVAQFYIYKLNSFTYRTTGGKSQKELDADKYAAQKNLSGGETIVYKDLDDVYYANESKFTNQPVPFIYVSPGTILANEIPQVDIHFIDSKNRVEDPFLTNPELNSDEYLWFTAEVNINSDEYKKDVNERQEEIDKVIDEANTSSNSYTGSDSDQDLARLVLYSNGRIFDYKKVDNYSKTNLDSNLSYIKAKESFDLDNAIEKFNDYSLAYQYYLKEHSQIEGSKSSYVDANSIYYKVAKLDKNRSDVKASILASDASQYLPNNFSVGTYEVTKPEEAYEKYTQEAYQLIEEVKDTRLSPEVLTSGKQTISYKDAVSSNMFESFSASDYNELRKRYTDFLTWYGTEYDDYVSKLSEEEKKEIEDNIENKKKEAKERKLRSTNIAEALSPTIKKWFNYLRIIAIILLAIVLVYLGIRILLSISLEDKAKYKEALTSWITAVGLILCMAIIIVMITTIYDMLIGIANSGINSFVVNGSPSYGDPLINKVRMELGLSFLMDDSVRAIGYLGLYLGLIVLTFYLLFNYMIRVILLMFLTIISPMVALTYPIDKYADHTAQAFNGWLKEYIAALYIQPIQLILYRAIMDLSLASVAIDNPIFGLLCLVLIYKVPEYIKDLFKIKGSDDLLPDAHKFINVGVRNTIQNYSAYMISNSIIGNSNKKDKDDRKKFEDMSDKEQDQVLNMARDINRFTNLVNGKRNTPEIQAKLQEIAMQQARANLKKSGITPKSNPSDYSRLLSEEYNDLLSTMDDQQSRKKAGNAILKNAVFKGAANKTYKLAKGTLIGLIGTSAKLVDSIGHMALGDSLTSQLIDMHMYSMTTNLLDGAMEVSEWLALASVNRLIPQPRSAKGYNQQQISTTGINKALAKAANSTFGLKQIASLSSLKNSKSNLVTIEDIRKNANIDDINEYASFLSEKLEEKIINSCNIDIESLKNIIKNLHQLNPNSTINNIFAASSILGNDNNLDEKIATYLSLNNIEYSNYVKDLEANNVNYEALKDRVVYVFSENKEKLRKEYKQKGEIISKSAKEIVQNSPKSKDQNKIIERIPSKSNIPNQNNENKVSETSSSQSSVNNGSFFYVNINNIANTKLKNNDKNTNNKQKYENLKEQIILEEYNKEKTKELNKEKRKEQKEQGKQREQKERKNKKEYIINDDPIVEITNGQNLDTNDFIQPNSDNDNDLNE